MARPIGHVQIPVDGAVTRGVLHGAEGAMGGAILVGGAGGGLYGPAGGYPELADRLQAEGFAALRLDYRRPNRLGECVQDVLAGIDFLAARGVTRVVLVGWSFGGAVVICAGAASSLVIGVATVASQTRGTDAVGHLAPRSLLLLHGTADLTLPDRCSRDLYARARQPKELVLYPGDGHGIDRHREQMIEKLYAWGTDLLAGS